MSEQRPFPPSPRRLALARRAGLHGASPHVTTAAAWIAFLVAAIGLGHAIAASLGELIARACGGGAPDPAGAVAALPRSVLALVVPLIGVAAIAALVAHVAQTGALWLPRRRLERAPRLPRDAEHRRLAFAAAIGIAAFGWLWLAAPALARGASARTIATAATTLAIAAVAVAAIDALVRRVQLGRALAMTPAERREDDRLAGADPRWRALRGKLAREDDVAAAVARAALVVLGDDVAVAIAWDPAREPVPLRTAAGERARATQLVALARRYRLPIHRDPALAAALAAATGAVPAPHWPRLAEIVAAIRRP